MVARYNFYKDEISNGEYVLYEDYKMLEKEARQAYGEKGILELKNKKEIDRLNKLCEEVEDRLLLGAMEEKRLYRENKKLKEEMQYLKDLDCDDKTAITLRAYKIALAKCLNDIHSRYQNKKDFFERWGNEYELAEGYTNILGKEK
jgi:hypothetical protein